MADKNKMQELTQKFDEVIELAQKLDGVQELAQRLDEMIELAQKLNEVEELARKLDDWAEKLPDEQKNLLRRLLSRGAYTEERIDRRRVKGEATFLFKEDIKQAVKDALKPLIKTNLPDIREDWPRLFSTWTRFDDGWPRDGYWALGMGCPPELDKMPPDIPLPPKGPKTPSVE